MLNEILEQMEAEEDVEKIANKISSDMEKVIEKEFERVKSQIKKKYNYRTFDSIYSAIGECNANQNWQVINIYPTGWGQEVCVVYYTLQ